MTQANYNMLFFSMDKTINFHSGGRIYKYQGLFELLK